MNEGTMAIFFMFFMTPVAIISIVLANRYHTTKMKLQAQARNAQGEQWSEEITRRLEKIEKRLANLETIVIETEKSKEFERL